MPPPTGLPLYRSDYVKSKKVVLEEEEFTNALELIIERDFFPESSKLRERNEPEDTGSALSESIKAKRSINLDKFIGRYTSEDSKSALHIIFSLFVNISIYTLMKHVFSDQSFEELHAKDLQERRKKLPWLYEPEDPTEKAVKIGRTYPNCNLSSQLIVRIVFRVC